MDRFIGVPALDLSEILLNLKSNMDRFIVHKNGLIHKIYGI